jgi:TRAP-type mannitol/chloroaromatic compound transport system permease small subunit
MVVIQFLVVILRYVFGIGSIQMQESIMYLHAMTFLGGAAYTLQNGGHVRVDIFYSAMSERKKALIDLLGSAFLLIPFCILVWIKAYPYVLSSWSYLEGSKETSGIPAVFLLKTLILVFVVLVVFQGVATIIQCAQKLLSKETA